MTAGRAAELVAAVVLVTFMGGCSVVFVTPARTARKPELDAGCTESRTAPIVDGIVTAAGLAWAAVAFAATDRFQNAATTNVAIGLGVTGAFLGSSIYGQRQTAECTRLKELYKGAPPTPPVPAAAPPPAAPQKAILKGH